MFMNVQLRPDMTDPITTPSYSTTRCLSISSLDQDGNEIVAPSADLSSAALLLSGRAGGLRRHGLIKHGYGKTAGVWYRLSESGDATKVVAKPETALENGFPLISVVIVVYNGEKYLEDAILSVLEQDYSNVELLIIDGGSKDGTGAILEEYQNAIDYWVSERDAGIYDAMNKAVDASRGQWLYFLGADDELNSRDVLARIAEKITLSEKTNPLLVFGQVITDKGKVVHSKFTSKLLLHNSLHHQSCFYHRQVFASARFDSSLKMISDYEINLMAYLNSYAHVSLDLIVAMCRDGGVSTDPRTYAIYMEETNLIRSRVVRGFRGHLLKVLFNLKSRLYHVIRHF